MLIDLLSLPPYEAGSIVINTQYIQKLSVVKCHIILNVGFVNRKGDHHLKWFRSESDFPDKVNKLYQT